METTLQSSPNYLQENFDDFFNEALSGFIITDAKGCIVRANSKITEWSGSTSAALQGKRFHDLLNIGGKIYYETHLSPLLRMQGYFDEVVLEIKHSNGQKMRAMVNALERRDVEGKLLFVRFTIVKATDRLLYEQNLQNAKNVAEEETAKQTNTVALREQFIAVLGHDLRNPLSAIRMVAEMLEISEDIQNVKELATILKRSSDRMTELVNNIMDFAKTRMGEGIIISSVQADLQPVIQQVANELKLANPKREIIINCNLEERIICDPNRIAQLLSNLVANALTHGTPDTPVYINTIHNGSKLQISVINNGEQIPNSMIENIFAPFTRETSRPSQQGLGLGLFISKEIARAHGGTLLCTSNVKETIFTFSM